MGVDWGVKSLTIIKVDRAEGGKGPNYAFFERLGKCKVTRIPHLHKGLGTSKENLWWRMKIQMDNGNYEV
jgi:hypothetical protein